MRVADQSFVVVDCETTGFHPNAYHRVIELALVPVERGTIGDTWVTLLNPERDLGAVDVHGIRGRDLLEAPRFADVLGEVVDRIAGRVIVAHNARFDCAFLEHELSRAGVAVGALPALCTMEIAGRFGVGGGRGRLADCCGDAGVDHDRPHTAEGDASACAELFLRLLPHLRDAELRTMGCREPIPPDAWPRSERRAPCVQRAQRFGARREPSFLARLTQAAPAPTVADAMEVIPYLDILDRALEDRRLSTAEQEDLAAAASMLGLCADRVRRVHADYVATLIEIAYRDGVVTDREREDLDLVSEALGVEGVDQALAHRSRNGTSNGGSAGAELSGKSVCFTGALLCEYEGTPMTREVAQLLAEQAGLVVAPRVTRSLDLLVVADPNSMSGKARKAREYGTRIVSETAFWPMIGVDVT